MPCNDHVNLIIKSTGGGEIWLGDAKAAVDQDFIKSKGITVIINCTPDFPFIYETSGYTKAKGSPAAFETARAPVGDHPSENQNMLDCMQEIIPFIQDRFDANKKILIHCMAGKSRSASMLAAFYTSSLHKYQKVQKGRNTLQRLTEKDTPIDIVLSKVIADIISKRNCAFFYGSRFNFLPAMQSYVKSL